MDPRPSGSKDGKDAEEDSTIGHASLSRTAVWADAPPAGGPCAFLAGAAGGAWSSGSGASGGALGVGTWPGSAPGAGAWPGAAPSGGVWPGAPPGDGGAWPGVPPRGGAWPGGPWWKNVLQEIKGCSRFRYKGLQDEKLEDLGNTGDDRWSASSGSCSSQGSRSCENSPINVDEEGEADSDDSRLEEVTPTSGRGKRGGGPVNNKVKKPRTTTDHWFQEQLGKLVEMSERTAVLCESIARRRRDERPGCSIQDVMALVKECGATPGTDEHFIATILFTKRAQREMFMTLGSHEDRFDWLRRKHEWMTRNDVSK